MMVLENRRHMRVGGGVTNEDERVPAAEPDGTSEDGSCERHQ